MESTYLIRFKSPCCQKEFMDSKTTRGILMATLVALASLAIFTSAISLLRPYNYPLPSTLLPFSRLSMISAISIGALGAIALIFTSLLPFTRKSQKVIPQKNVEEVSPYFPLHTKEEEDIIREVMETQNSACYYVYHLEGESPVSLHYIQYHVKRTLLEHTFNKYEELEAHIKKNPCLLLSHFELAQKASMKQDTASNYNAIAVFDSNLRVRKSVSPFKYMKCLPELSVQGLKGDQLAYLFEKAINFGITFKSLGISLTDFLLRPHPPESFVKSVQEGVFFGCALGNNRFCYLEKYFAEKASIQNENRSFHKTQGRIISSHCTLDFLTDNVKQARQQKWHEISEQEMNELLSSYSYTLSLVLNDQDYWKLPLLDQQTVFDKFDEGQIQVPKTLSKPFYFSFRDSKSDDEYVFYFFKGKRGITSVKSILHPRHKELWKVISDKELPQLALKEEKGVLTLEPVSKPSLE